MTCGMASLALVRDMRRPAPCEQLCHDWAFPLPRVTKLPAAASRHSWAMAAFNPHTGGIGS